MLRIGLTILFQVMFLGCVAKESMTILEDKARTPILSPSLAQRQTLKLRLANGLEAYLISDPEATKSAAGLVVEAGSWEDPAQYPGLAHFLEHMLFLGTEKYPIESDYDRFIKEHDGEANAYTASDYTMYLFSINHDAFEEALDRFSYFFKKPLFNPSGVARELQAIDQEFAKNFNDDDIREHYVLKEIANPNHPFHRFSAGNSTTLTAVSQKTLKDWYRDHYSANLMRLVVYSPLPIETLKKLVTQDFKDVPTTNRPDFHLNVPLIAEQAKGQMVFIDPLKEIRTLRLIWDLPSAYAHMLETKPESLICYVLGDEGPGSLLNELKQEDLATSLDCHGYRLGPDNALFSLNIDLTEKGLQQVNLIVQHCFEAIAQLKKEGLPAYIYNELKQMDTIRYEFQAREHPFEYIMKLGDWLAHENMETFPEHSIIIQSFDPQAANQLLNELTPQNLTVIISAKPSATSVMPDRKEAWMGIPYALKPFTKDQIHRWTDLAFNPHLRLPGPNPFVPQGLQLTFSSSETQPKIAIPKPETLINNDEAKVYFAKDQVFGIPQIVWTFEIKTPEIERGDPLKVVLADLYIKCLNEALNPFSFSATLAELNYEIKRLENGLSLIIKGYSPKVEVLFDAILQKLKTCQPTEEAFLTFKDSLLRDYQNFIEESAIEQGLETYQSIIYERFTSNQQKAKAIEPVTYQQLLDYIKHLYDQTYVTALFYGDIEKENALKLYEKLKNQLNSTPYHVNEHLKPAIISLPNAKGPFYLETQIKAQGNATILGVEDAGFSFKTRAAQQILMQAMSGPFYSALRTQQQTGYLVFTKAEEIEKHLFNFFIVQSNTHDPRDLLARFELFIEGFLQEMSEQDLTKERFEIVRSSLLTTIEQPPQNLLDMGALLSQLAIKYEGDFDWIEKRIQGFKDLDYETFLEIASQSLGKVNKRRLAILVEGILPEGREFKYKLLKNANEIRQTSQYTNWKQN